MINDEIEKQEDDLEITSEEVEQEQEQEEEQGVEYWKAEALKNKAILERNKNKLQKEPKKSDDFGLDVKGYLKASGIASTEFDFVKAEMKASGETDIDSLLENDYFKAKLEKHREATKTKDAVPTGKRSGGVATGSVDYWLAKPIEDVPANMRREVVNAKLKQENSQGKFYNS